MAKVLRELGAARIARAVALGFGIGFGAWLLGRCAIGAELLRATADGRGAMVSGRSY